MSPRGTAIRALFFADAGKQFAILGRFEGEQRKYALPPTAYVQSGRTMLKAIERRDGFPCPVFRVEQQSYIGLEAAMYTEIRLRSATGDALDWSLGNGLKGKGESLSVIAVGLGDLTVQTDAGKFNGRGRVVFAEVPRQASSQNRGDYRRYLDTMIAGELSEADLETLAAYLHFATLYDREPGADVIALAWLRHQKGGKMSDEVRAAWVAVARSAAPKQPERAADAWQRLDKANAFTPALWHEYLEFQLYRLGAPKDLDSDLREAARKLGQDDRLIPVHAFTARLLRGEIPEARKIADELRARQARDPESRNYRIRANAALETLRERLDAGQYLAAEAALRDWIADAPEALMDGQYALERARWLAAIGWHAQIPALIDATLQLNELPAFLPDLELAKADALTALGRLPEAQVLYRQIAEAYPNHPVAARTRLKQ